MFLAKLRRQIFRYQTFWRYFLLFIVTIAIIVISTSFIVPSVKLAFNILSGPINFLTLVNPTEVKLKQSDGRTNILLLGIGGGTHDGPDLTDSMMVVSLPSNASSSAYLISLPRDIYLNDLENKINSAYDQGNEKKTGGGLLLAKSAVSEVTGLNIDYAFVMDFSGFEKAVDILGGIDVVVPNTFDDDLYPIAGKENDLCDKQPGLSEEQYPCRYEKLHFDAGPAHLNGSTALKFVRSRHSTGDEGTDFARARRQQIVIEAVKTKVLSAKTLLAPQKLNDLYLSFKENITTDLSRDEIGQLIKFGLNQKDRKVESLVLSMDLFVNPPIDQRGWILIPRDGTFEEIKALIKSKLENTNSSSSN